MSTQDPPPAPPRAHRAWFPWRWVLGGCGACGGLVLLIFGISLALGVVVGRRQSGGARGVPTTHFVNRLEDLEGDWSRVFVPFSFDYPTTWSRDPGAGGPDRGNFVKVERKLVEDGKQYTLENFAVGHFRSEGKETSETRLKEIASAVNGQLAASLPGYRKVSEQPVSLYFVAGHEFRFESSFSTAAKGEVTLWGRVVLLPYGEDRGLSLVMVASSLVPGMESAADVGGKGELPVILESFKILGASPR